MGFDVTSGGAPTEQPMSDEEGVVTVRIEDPCGGTHVASRHDRTTTVVMIKSRNELFVEVIFGVATCHLMK
jgi:hypothetical protein